MKIIFTTIIACILFIDCVLGQDIVSLTPVKDTYVNSAIPNHTQGNMPSLIASAWTYDGVYGTGHSLIGFALPLMPDTLELIKATLYLYYNYSSAHVGHSTNGMNSAKLYKTTGDWNENTTWYTRPTYNSGSFAIVPASTSPTQNYEIDVTGIVLNNLSEGEIGFYLKLDYEQTYRSLVFASSDHPQEGLWPKLELIYSSDTIINPPDTIDFPIDPVLPCVENVEVPNIITPNSDGRNDYFEIRAECEYDFFHVEIYNRWGKKVYESNDISFRWAPDDLSEGVYFYVLTFAMNGRQSPNIGSVSIVR